MNIALVGKFSNQWGAEHSVQRGFWALGHEVQTVELIQERAHDHIIPGPEYDRDPEDHAYLPRIVNTDARAIHDADLTVVMQGYGMLPETIVSMQRHTENPVILWHAEVMSPEWPTHDPVVQAKAAQLQHNVRAYDLVCHNCYCCLDHMKALGAKKVAWCPANGVDARIHQRLTLGKPFDIGIYGWASERRVAIAREVIRLLNVSDGEEESDDESRPPQYVVTWPDAAKGGIYGDALTQYINQCRCIVNIHFSETLNTENRLYESLGCGVPCVSERVSMPELFPEGYGVRYAETPEAMATAIQDLLRLDPSAYQSLADPGYELVHQRYRYQDRCAQLLEAVEKELR